MATSEQTDAHAALQHADEDRAPRRVLLLSHDDLVDGTDASPWLEAAGYEVERVGAFASMVDLLQHRGSDTRTGAVVLGNGALADEEDGESTVERVAALSDLTRELGLPLIALTTAAEPPPWLTELDAEPHVVVLGSPVSAKALAAVLQGVSRRRRLHELEGKLSVMAGRLGDLETAGKREERLLARVGHELRNPLSAITTALSLMREMGDTDAHGQGERYRQIIERQVELLRQATDNLLDMAGIDSHPNPEVEESASRQDPALQRAAHLGVPILVVEDDRDGRAALSELLRLWGYDVTMADDGVAGVAHAEEHRPAVALVDIDLPGLNGYEVARKIRDAHPDDTPLLVAMTGFGQPEDERRALEAGFDVHLVKPVQPSQLARLLEVSGGASTSGLPQIPILPIETDPES